MSRLLDDIHEYALVYKQAKNNIKHKLQLIKCFKQIIYHTENKQQQQKSHTKVVLSKYVENILR